MILVAVVMSPEKTAVVDSPAPQTPEVRSATSINKQSFFVIDMAE